MATFPAKTNYAAGDILTAAQMVDIGDQLNALNGTVGKNKIINGDFRIWQRGTSFSSTVDQYTADRFFYQRNNTNTVSQQTFSPGTAPVAGYEGQYFWRVARTTTAGGADFLYQRIEDVRTLAGQTVTFSFWAKADSALNIGSVDIDQVFGSGGSATVTTSLTTNLSVTTSWVRYSYTVTVPSISGKTIGTNSHLRPRINLTTASSATFDTWGWQLEAGSVATAFQTATGTLAGELAACQRYYYRFSGDTNSTLIPAGFANSTVTASGQVQFPVPMRIAPTSLDSSGLKFANYAGSAYAMSSVAFNEHNAFGAQVYGTVSGVTAGHVGKITCVSNGSYYGFSAEL